ncbi:hypothetical protein JKA74_18825 [Marivirga sp. S37H4]|uniref:Lipoprotein n=1 Tax=Marivirga aurantiaca TaxID=2802615 RepID=A0A934X2I8_9BACT|nr:hypothetical protein [Marivirga aurantiaca]MBK6267106.1 hypothetical protein [Marivirga aurantiaca]
MKAILPILMVSFFLISCQEQKQKEQTVIQDNAVFEPGNSDSQAIVLADKVIEAHGGMEKWNKIRYVSWNFLGARDLVWDKYTGLVRIDFPGAESQFIININEDTGQVRVKNKLIKEPDSLKNLIDRGKQIWVNDSYWLIFPFKLKDPGVRLDYIGKDTTLAGESAEVISLQFDSVGYTPKNKYKAYINPETYLIMQWDYFKNTNDSTASFSNLWSDYKDFEGIKLAAGRDERRLDNIQLSNELDTAVFEF